MASDGFPAGRCVHFTGIQHKTCRANIAYSQWRGGSLPCIFKKFRDDAPEAPPCAHRRAPTSEEIDAHKRYVDARVEKITLVMRGISDWRAKHRGKSASEVIECPACKGRLHLSISAYNGHVHGHCETEGCAQWME